MRDTWQPTGSRNLAGNPARQLAASPLVRVIAWLALNMVAAVAMDRSSLVATALALLAVGAGLYFLAFDETRERLIYVTGYIVGVEVLWRGTGAGVFWEFGKYALIVLLVLGLIKEQRLFRAPKLPIFYFVLLIPSIALLSSFNREDIAFNLSGPLALAVATMYFNNIKLTSAQLERLLLAILGPIVGLAFLVNVVIWTAESLVIVVGGTATSAGIGPNQVSSILGLGMVAAFFLAILYTRHRGLRSLMILIVIWLVVQSALTLSRGGLWAGLGAISIASLFLARDRQMRTVLIFMVIVGYSVLNFVALPALDEFTGDIVTARLRDFDLTGRDQIMRADWLIFQQNPLFGVGPGQSYNLHALKFRASSAHNEYTRLLAEHGSLGLAALLILFVLAGRLLTRPQRPFAKAFTVAAVAYALLFLFHSAMRLAAPAYLFGLAAATLVLEPEDDEQAGDLV
jgi:hypothetical protein